MGRLAVAIRSLARRTVATAASRWSGPWVAARIVREGGIASAPIHRGANHTKERSPGEAGQSPAQALRSSDRGLLEADRASHLHHHPGLDHSGIDAEVARMTIEQRSVRTSTRTRSPWSPIASTPPPIHACAGKSSWVGVEWGGVGLEPQHGVSLPGADSSGVS